MQTDQAYAFLLDHHHETSMLASMGALLHWDQSTMIPPAGNAHRAQQMASLTGLVHARNTDPAIGEALEACKGMEAGPDQAANLREWTRAYERAVKIPMDLAKALARTASESEVAWQVARPENDWPAFRPHLEELVSLKREEAEAVGYASEPYDALLDVYEPGETAAALVPVFEALREPIAGLLGRIIGSGRLPEPILRRPYPLDRQREFCIHVAGALGYDFQAGRLDVSAHPFSTTIGPGDSRITTRFQEDDFGNGFFSTVHETGHALYEQGLPVEHWGTPRGEAVSLGVHESQSRLWENFVARSKGFWRHFLPQAKERFDCLSDVGLSAFHFAANEVRPGLLRVDADEVTYNLHVLLRFELELALVRGDLAVADLPGAFDEKMRDTLGLTPPDYKDGVMQDVHWSAGIIGYFPTYTLGNVYAAQIWRAAGQALGDLEDMFSRGEFRPLLDWLREQVHGPGSLHQPRTLMERVTGSGPDPSVLAEVLEQRYAEAYRL